MIDQNIFKNNYKNIVSKSLFFNIVMIAFVLFLHPAFAHPDGNTPEKGPQNPHKGDNPPVQPLPFLGTRAYTLQKGDIQNALEDDYKIHYAQYKFSKKVPFQQIENTNKKILDVYEKGLPSLVHNVWVPKLEKMIKYEIPFELLVLSGPPGTGKSMIVDYLCRTGYQKEMFDIRKIMHEKITDETFSSIFKQIRKKNIPTILNIEEFQTLLPNTDATAAFWLALDDEMKMNKLKKHKAPLVIVITTNNFDDFPKQVKNRISPQSHAIVRLPGPQQRIDLMLYIVSTASQNKEYSPEICAAVANYIKENEELIKNKTPHFSNRGVANLAGDFLHIFNENHVKTISRKQLNQMLLDATQLNPSDIKASSVPCTIERGTDIILNVRDEIVKKLIDELPPHVRVAINDLSTRGLLQEPCAPRILGVTGPNADFVAKMIAHQGDSTFLSVKATEIPTSYQNSGAENTKKLFQEAMQASINEQKPVILYIKGIDELLGQDANTAKNQNSLDAFHAMVHAISEHQTNPNLYIIIGMEKENNFSIDPALLELCGNNRIVNLQKLSRDAVENILRTYFNLLDISLPEIVDLKDYTEEKLFNDLVNIATSLKCSPMELHRFVQQVIYEEGKASLLNGKKMHWWDLKKQASQFVPASGAWQLSDWILPEPPKNHKLAYWGPALASVGLAAAVWSIKIAMSNDMARDSDLAWKCIKAAWNFFTQSR